MKIICTIAGVLLGMVAIGQAEPSLAPVFTDNMVLQREIAVPVWGKADPGERISVSFAGQVRETQAAADGSWMVRFAPLKASRKPAELTVSGKTGITLKNILVGEVWLCSGQSNMEMGVGQVKDALKEIAAADKPEIRFFMVPNSTAFAPKREIEGASWKVCDPAIIAQNGYGWAGFSAAGYFFGREINKELDVPVGLIESDWGGTPAQSWTPIEYLQANPVLAHYGDEYTRDCRIPKSELAGLEKQRTAIIAEMQKRAVDPGNKGEVAGWQNEGADLAGWDKVKVPNGWFPDKTIYGSVWFRRDVDVPEAWAGRDLVLNLGLVDDFDTTYFNGRKIGAIGKDTPEWWTVKRSYKVPGALVKAGRNTIAVRVFNDYMGGGLPSAPEAFVLGPPVGANEEPLKIAGEWFRKIEDGKAFPVLPAFQNCPSCLYNAMIAPLIPFAIRGAIWYQGESNAGNAHEYSTLFPTMIKSWRDRWGQGDFPFYFVQLANFMPVKDQPADSAWAELRDAQRQTLATFNTDMAVIIDIGDAKDIHPKNKQEVGRRLALNALANTYGRNVESSGPVARSMKIEEGAMRIFFDHCGGGLKARDSKGVKGFAICGADLKFVWADAKITGHSILVSSPEVRDPVAVRYAWADNPVCNLVNKSGLPASPFRTDHFKGITER